MIKHCLPLLLITAAILANATVASAETVSKPAGSKPVGGPPNIIVIMPDDSSYGNYSCLGNPIIKTPHIDDLKKESLLLTQYHSSARCSPSRAKLLSGRHEFMSGVTHTQHGRERLSLDTVTLPQSLQSAFRELFLNRRINCSENILRFIASGNQWKD